MSKNVYGEDLKYFHFAGINSINDIAKMIGKFSINYS